MGQVEKAVSSGIDIAPVVISIGVLVTAIVILGVIVWTVIESGHGAFRFIRDRRNDGPARRRFQACFGDIYDCRRSIEVGGFGASLIIHSDLYAKLTNLSECLAALGIACPPVDRGNARLALWHIRLKELAIHAELGNIEAAQRPALGSEL